MFNKILIMLGLVLSFAVVSIADVPRFINYQGYLTDTAGNPLSGSFTIQFRIYSTSTGGSPLWGPESYTVNVDNGYFSVVIGPIDYDVFNGDERYLSLQVGSDPEMSPRKRMVTVSYSYKSHRAQDADKLEGKSADEFVQTLDNVPPNSSGNIDLVAGNNITISPDASNNRITIAATTGGGGADNDWIISGNDQYSAVSGNVGIGTTNPTVKLDVNGGARGYVSSTRYGYLGDNTGGAFGQYSSGRYGWLGVSSGGAYGQSSSNIYGYLGTSNYGAYGQFNSTRYGYLGSNNYGAYGQYDGNRYGYLGGTSAGAYGTLNSSQGWLGHSNGGAAGQFSSSIFGYLGTNNYGAYGQNGTRWGALGTSSYGAYGQVSSTRYGLLGHSTGGAFGQYSSGRYGWLGVASGGAYGQSSSSIYGYLGTSNYGAYGQYLSTRFGYLGSSSAGVYGQYSSSRQGWLGHSFGGVAAQSSTSIFAYLATSNRAGSFTGNVHVSGTLTKTAGAFQIDHPLDPANKYLNHSFVESPDMMNVYNGNVQLDANGEAWVELPDWFQALNKDYRYQLTPIGAPGPNLHIAEKISNNRFKIAGGAAGMEVSWQVTGVRQDAYANAHRLQVEVEKTGKERGRYLHPELYGMPAEMRTNYEEWLALQPTEENKIEPVSAAGRESVSTEQSVTAPAEKSESVRAEQEKAVPPVKKQE